ncbi:MAG: hypothetical protein D6729_17455, partial [Deltaproteobacteria bacterium]
MRRLAAVLFSLLVLAGAAVGLRTYLKRALARTLKVEARPGPGAATAPVRFDVLERPTGHLEARVDSGTGAAALQPLPGGLEAWRLDPTGLSPGLHRVRFELTYLGRPPRGVVFGVITGPFAEPDAPVPCGVQVVARKAALDAIAEVLVRTLAARLATGPLPPVRRTEVELALVPSGIDATARVEFEGDSVVEAHLPLSVSFSPAGDLALARRGAVEASASGAVGTLAALKGGGLMAAIAKVLQDPEAGLAGALDAAKAAGDRQAAAEVERALDAWLPQLNRALAETVPTRLSTHLFGQRVTMALSPCGEPAIRGKDALVLRYDATVEVQA